MSKEQKSALLKLVQAVVNAEVALSWAVAQPLGEREDLTDARTRAWVSLRTAIPDDMDAVVLGQLQRKAACWDQLMELAGHWQDGSDESVTLTQDDATRQCVLRVGRNARVRSFYAASFAACLSEAKS